jgi:hypothetical protein
MRRGNLSNNARGLTNTRLQPGDEELQAQEPFQRLVWAEKPLKRLWRLCRTRTGLKPGVKEMALPVWAMQKIL